MSAYEYKAIPAPTRGEKVKGLKTPTDRFAHALSAEINRMAAEGWDYVRAETLPSEERSGLTGRNTVYHNLLIFRRQMASAALRSEVTATVAAPQPAPAAQPAADAAARAAAPQPAAQPAARPVAAQAQTQPQPRAAAEPPVKSPANPLSALRPQPHDTQDKD